MDYAKNGGYSTPKPPYIAAMAALAFLCATTTSNYAYAQVNIPSSADPSRQRAVEPTTPRIQVEPLIAPTKTKEPQLLKTPKGAEKIKFTLKQLTIEGTSVYANEELRTIYGAFIGKEISIAELYGIVNAITTRYHQDGYILSRAYIPPQESNGGNIRIKVIEGFVDEVEFESKMPSPGLIHDILAPLTQGNALNIYKMEKASLLLNRLPGVSVNLVLAPMDKAKAQEGSVKLVIVPTLKKYSGSATLDNTGSKFLGPFRAKYNAVANHLLAAYHRIDATISHTPASNELRAFNATYQLPLNGTGTMLSVSGDVSRSELGFNLKNLEVDGHSGTLSIKAEHPLLLSREDTLLAAVGFNYSNSNISVLEAPLSKDRIRSVSTSLSYSGFDSYNATNAASITLTQGLGILNASKTGDSFLSRADATQKFTKGNFTLSRLQNLGDGWQLYLSSTGQYSADTLFSSQEFGYGGKTFGRGYDASEITGDHGVSGLAEVRYHTLKHEEFTFIPFAFYDFGKVWQKDTSGSDQSIGSSAGLGMYIFTDGSISATIYAAKPLKRGAGNTGNGSNPNRTKFLFSLQTSF